MALGRLISTGPAPFLWMCPVRCPLVGALRDLWAGLSLQVLLKLFSYCVKVKVNRQQLVKLEMNTLNVMLGTLNLVRSVGYGR